MTDDGLTAVVPDADGRFAWGNGVVTMTFETGGDKPVRLSGLSGRGMGGGVGAAGAAVPAGDDAVVDGNAAAAGGNAASHDGGTVVFQRDPRPIVEVRAAATGSHDNRQPLILTVAGSKLRFVGARASEPESGSREPYRLEITQFASYESLKPGGRPMDSIDPGSAASADATLAGADGQGSTAETSGSHADGLTVTSVFEAYPGISAVRAYTVLHSPQTFPIESASSLNLTLPMDANGATVESSRIFWGDAAWAVENDWHSAPLRKTAVRDRNQIINPGESSSRFVRSSASTWSTGLHEPAGIIEADRDAAVAQSTAAHVANVSNTTDPAHVTADGQNAHVAAGNATSAAGGAVPAFSVMWQIEHNGPWEWEVGENDPGLHVAAFGPEYQDHQWSTDLGDGNDCTTVPVSFSIASGGWQQAVAEMTLQRRALRAAKAAELGRSAQFERTQGLVVYNDYMNTLFGDPRIEKELPLIDGAAKAGADIFCIDAGWYDSTDGGWWDMVGEWLPSTNRFGEEGLAGLAARIREAGMGLGLWLEPEVIGVKSPLAATLPDEAFFTRHGVRVCDSGRYLLDFRSQAAREHVTRTVDRLIADFDVKFFKFDYNTIPGAGTDRDAESVGSGLLDHCRTYLDWLDDLRRRHPDVMIENCGSGAMRADYAQLSRLDLQSTSDQCDPLIYAAIAAGAGLTILPEQQGNWGYAQQEMDDETAVLTLAAGVMGRLYLSGFINRMDDTRLALVRDAVALQRRILARQETLVPWWPAGLPDFDGDWLVAGLRPYAPVAANDADNEATAYVTAWRRAGSSSIDLPLEEGREITQIFPAPVTDTARDAGAAIGDAAEGATDGINGGAVANHAPNARPWTIERLDPSTVRLAVSDATRPSARIFAVR
ncbi:glycoside hydrolase family 36 protein [Bifidobacterium simiiventris]|uniref:glycoside hydrolase family 36 protein n=1 Tax=Bifidobacterium simiiventris TaxID=2834434 RepID=UPI001F266E8C|nr:glycoside hydrolase family 36 protein [Bifidobacterium simiiventris]